MNKIYLPILKDIHQTAEQNGIKIRSSRKRFVYAEGENIGCAGYFSDEAKELAYSTFGKTEDVMNLVIHESCHMDQFIEDKYLWNKYMHGYDYFFKWLESTEYECPKRLMEYVSDIIAVELDCEKRAIRKIKKYNLPVDIKEYIQKANAYLYGYIIILQDRKFYQRIYSVDYVWKASPSTFKKTYKTIPVKLLRAFNKRKKEI